EGGGGGGGGVGGREERPARVYRAAGGAEGRGRAGVGRIAPRLRRAHVQPGEPCVWRRARALRRGGAAGARAGHTQERVRGVPVSRHALARRLRASRRPRRGGEGPRRDGWGDSASPRFAAPF